MPPIDMTTVASAPAFALAGTDLSPHIGPVDTFVVEGSSAIDFGKPIARGTARTDGIRNGKLFNAATDVFVGFTLRDTSEQVATNGTSINYPQYSNMPVKRGGHVAVPVEENVTEGDNVLIIVSTGGLGSSRNGVANGSTRIAIKGWQFNRTTSAGGIGEVVGEVGPDGKTTT